MNLEEIAKILSDNNEKVIRKANEFVPDRKAIITIIKDIQSLMLCGYFESDAVRDERPSPLELLQKIRRELITQLESTAKFRNEFLDSESIADEFIARLPEVKELLLKDIIALYEGDPAAKSKEEIIICYPGFYAISIYRIAHILYELKVPIIPRIMTEFAHEKTGIDIHAGAKIGEYFFIDHGTGIVIGETTVIGNRVKLYQGVTLGARSFETDENGNPVKDIKRHPNIGNNVVIYANATILGGDTYIGDNCVIGGSVWLTNSVESGKKVYYSAKN